MRQTALAKRAAAKFPARALTGSAGKRPLQSSQRFAFEAIGKTQFSRAATQQSLGRLSDQLFTRPIDQSQALLSVKGKNRHVDSRHHFAEKRGRLFGAQALLAHGLAEII